MIRTWIIIEDGIEKAEGIIPYILQKHPEDEIRWIYPYSKGYPGPRLFSASLEDPLTYLKAKISPFQSFNGETLSGNIDFYWCTDEATFIQACNSCFTGNSILLLDIELDALGIKRALTPMVKKIAHQYLDIKEAVLISLISIATNPYLTIANLDLTEDETKIMAGAYSFTGAEKNKEKDYEALVKSSHEKWMELYNPRYSFDHFWGTMATYSSLHFHNWSEPEKQTADKRPTWDKEWKVPIQLRCLIEALHYEDHHQFLEDLRLTSDMEKNRPLGECLKGMGTLDTRGISLLAALLICWMAFRKLFGKDNRDGIKDINQKFINAILSCESKQQGGSYLVDTLICRVSLISPPQTLKSTQNTAKALYEMMLKLLEHKDGNKTCTLQRLVLDKRGLQLSLEINPNSLSQSVHKQYRHKFIQPDSAFKGGDTAEKIIAYFRRSNYFDGNIHPNEKIPFLGSNYGLRILPDGENRTLFKFSSVIANEEKENH